MTAISVLQRSEQKLLPGEAKSVHPGVKQGTTWGIEAGSTGTGTALFLTPSHPHGTAMTTPGWFGSLIRTATWQLSWSGLKRGSGLGAPWPKVECPHSEHGRTTVTQRLYLPECHGLVFHVKPCETSHKHLTSWMHAVVSPGPCEKIHAKGP